MTRMSAHSHPDKQHVVRSYRQYILGFKRTNGTARGLVHYRDIIRIYQACKLEVANGN